MQSLSVEEINNLQGRNAQLQCENEKLKKQYNCYACGNCNGKEDYINLEKHHKGLRKQFDELVKRNNTLSLRIEELEKENEKLKKILNMDAKSLTHKYCDAHKALLDIKAMVKFECKCTNEQVCICHVCDKYDAIITKIDGVIK